MEATLMAKSNPSVQKRIRERKKMERRQEKERRKAARKAAKEAGGGTESQADEGDSDRGPDGEGAGSELSSPE